MKRTPDHTDESVENDAVWKLLDKAPTKKAGPSFASDTVRLARLTGQPVPWWKKWFQPAPIAGFAMATAAVAIAFTFMAGSEPKSPVSPTVTYDSPQAETIQDIAETEVLIAAADNLNDYSDQELVCLIGF